MANFLSENDKIADSGLKNRLEEELPRSPGFLAVVSHFESQEWSKEPRIIPRDRTQGIEEKGQSHS